MGNAKAALAGLALVWSGQSVARNIVVTSAAISPKERSAILLDADTIRDAGVHKRAWIWMTVKTGQQTPMIASQLLEFDCDQERSRVLQSTFYKPDHSFLMQGEAEPWSYAVPASRNYSILATVCGKATIAADERMGDHDPFDLLDNVLAADPAD